ncbi:lipoprotein [Thiohalobacter sp. COW1]|uniref:YdbL family protein n=1 Tax=Thiohalobacter sp. COW1 TaxID=2795687 RepID=UPI0019164422|nr:YdbL family protein [Thiohalobacter sp. COW1]BCO31479.1 lipoprotein [Thiohalobacter sp. COW1]
MYRIVLAPWWLLLTLLAGCVTINVYFPAAAAEQAADRIIRDVYGVPQREEAPAQEQPAPAPDSRLESDRPLWVALLEAAVTPAAAAADINVQSPAINRLRAQMKARHQQLEPFYQQGAVGIAANGELRIRDMNAVALRDRARVQQLVAEENRDRQALYAEIARVNGHPEWQDEIRATFARRWVDNAPSGWWYQDAGGSWKQK